VRRQRLNGGWYAIMSLASFSMLKIQSGSLRDLGDQPMGGLNDRAEKLHAITIWALVIDNIVMHPVLVSKQMQAASDYNYNRDIPCCGKILRTSPTKAIGESYGWLRKKRRYGNNGDDWMIRMFTRWKNLGRQRLNGCGGSNCP